MTTHSLLHKQIELIRFKHNLILLRIVIITIIIIIIVVVVVVVVVVATAATTTIITKIRVQYRVRGFFGCVLRNRIVFPFLLC